MTTDDLRKEAGFDQMAAYFREQRHKLCKMLAESKKRHWWREPAKLRVLVMHLLREAESREEALIVVECALSKPWKYRVEYVLAECRFADTRRN